MESPSPLPSLHQFRKKRQHAAHALDMKQVDMRLCSLENQVTSMNGRLLSMEQAVKDIHMSLLGPSIRDLPIKKSVDEPVMMTPPGLPDVAKNNNDDTFLDSIKKRLSTLEEVFILVDWAALKEPADRVSDVPQSDNPEPEIEATPQKTLVPDESMSRFITQHFVITSDSETEGADASGSLDCAEFVSSDGQHSIELAVASKVNVMSAAVSTCVGSSPKSEETMPGSALACMDHARQDTDEQVQTSVLENDAKNMLNTQLPSEDEGECTKCGGDHESHACPYYSLERGVVPRIIKKHALKLAISRNNQPKRNVRRCRPESPSYHA